ncbi:MAG TPA: NBR1-Ig-like domain-containing protein [Galbitalea sp.]|nr:NBR1-Ig-like domain-containing protein [Galbitalea sp.]
MGRPEERLPTPTTPIQILGSTIRDFRHVAELSAKQVADTLGWHPSTLYSIEHGKRLPSEAFALALDTLLNADGVISSLYNNVLHEKRQSRLAASRTGTPARPVQIPGDESGWVRDVTVPDGSIFRPGVAFVKTWRIRNAGTVAWHDRYLRRMGVPAGHGIISSPILSPIPDALPGEEIDVSVSCIAQAHEGSSVAVFKMSDADRNLYFPTRYGVGLMLSITVIGS